MSETTTPTAATPDTITVNRKALFEILQALIGPAHLIRELQAIQAIQGDKSPITILVNEYNASLPPAPEEAGPDAAPEPA